MRLQPPDSGYHWFTNIVATRQLSSALYARLHADAEFVAMMEAARQEYQQQAPSAVETITPADETRRAAVYSIDDRRIDGQPQRSGVCISGGKKRLVAR